MQPTRRFFTIGLAMALAATFLPVAASANELFPGRPGQYELSSITIDATSGDCRATYETPAEGNLWVRGVDATVRVVTNPDLVHVRCRFTDMSYRIELNAEVGYTEACSLVTEDGTYSGGVGRVTSAANISERSEGGNSVITCHFRVDSEPPGASIAAAKRGRADQPDSGGEPTRAARADKAKTPAVRSSKQQRSIVPKRPQSTARTKGASPRDRAVADPRGTSRDDQHPGQGRGKHK